jgi:hypothetical protein
MRPTPNADVLGTSLGTGLLPRSSCAFRRKAAADSD